MTKPTGRPRGRPRGRDYITTAFRYPADLAERVKAYADRKRQPLSVVIRDALELLLEEDRYRPFVSNTNTVSDMVLDTKEESVDIVLDRKEEHVSHVFDTHAAQEDDPQAGGLCQTAHGTTTANTVVVFDPGKHVLGKLCPRGHAYQATGQSVLRERNRHCVLCDREKFHERPRSKRQQAGAH